MYNDNNNCTSWHMFKAVIREKLETKIPCINKNKRIKANYVPQRKKD